MISCLLFEFKNYPRCILYFKQEMQCLKRFVWADNFLKPFNFSIHSSAHGGLADLFGSSGFHQAILFGFSFFLWPSAFAEKAKRPGHGAYLSLRALQRRGEEDLRFSEAWAVLQNVGVWPSLLFFLVSGLVWLVWWVVWKD